MQRFVALPDGAWIRRVRAWRAWPEWRRPQPATPEVVARFAPLLVALRWGTLSLAVGLGVIEKTGRHVILVGIVLAFYTLWRTLWPIRYDQTGWRVSAALFLEVALSVAVIEATGFGRSPFLVCLVVATAIVGFAGGIRIVSWLSALAGLAVVLPSVILVHYRGVAGSSLQFAIEVVLVGVVGGFSRIVIDDTGHAQEGLTAHAEHLSEVNDLLLDLHRATAREPTPLDLDGAARWALERLEEMFSPDTGAVVLRDPVTGYWHLVAGKGVRVTGSESSMDLPKALATASAGTEPIALEALEQGLSFRSRWGLYCPLRARDELVGMLAVEWHGAHHVTPADQRRIGDLARAAALALDNARWLERIHGLGVEQERSRLARELHDHIGQSVVYLGFEIDRLVELNHGRAVQADLISLRSDVRNLVEELRDALVDLRSDVSETQGVDNVLRSFLERVNRRNRLAVTLTAEADTRLPLTVEREFWRVAQEAVMNAERHAHASNVSVLWLCNADGALLEVADNGVGMSAGKAAGASSYGLLGMRERADSVGAQLDITSGPDRGTVVRMRMKVA
ncbi:MAG TPA: histidine kinase [Acidimicrobiales bacterium]|nr:histidine kinase [Acidimicrobiales bacterium]